MSTRDERTTNRKATTLPSSLGNGTQSFVGSVIILGALLCLWMGSELQFLQAPEEIKLRSSSISDADHAMCERICTQRKESSKKNRFYGTATDLLNPEKLIQRAENAKRNLIEDLRKDYGARYFVQIFQDEETGEFRPIVPITPDGPSMERLKRKLLIKVLSAQSNVKRQEASVNDGRCDCLNGNQAVASKSRSTSEKTLSFNSPFFERYVWATGGHSSAAGHGNLFNETYTYYMERDLVDVFGAVGIEFVGRNYAMGGTSSGSEIAMCWEQIFGSDVDIFSWDFGMTDGKTTEKILLYGLRGGLSPGHPAFMGIHMGGSSRADREERIKDLEKMGMAAFMLDDTGLSNMKRAVPDSAGLGEQELAALPEYVRNLKCNDGFEKGEPFCDKEKFTHFICDNRGSQGSWHPGFKEHAMTGHAVSLFLTNALISALKSLREDFGDDDKGLLDQLRSTDEQAYTNLTQAALPTVYARLYQTKNEAIPPDFDQSIFYKGHNFCHTGRLPSQTRYLGYLTESDKRGGPAPWANVTYDTGLGKDEAIKNDAKGSMQLIFEGRGRVRDCPVTCMPDAKDSFMTHYKDGWAKISFPNTAERTAYRYDSNSLKGMLIIIFRSCDWGKCEKGFLRHEEFLDGKWEMKVNGHEVKDLINFGHDTFAAKDSNGIYFSPNSEGIYDVEIKVNEEGGYVLVSSFIIY
ncbi:hypothetical protein IV203_026091 [Nitzschia inconspicua]|uniref:Uncharacterized protein n=1 Tax=Nitzschia inconspicua TaxID=303405 RepID=A0A9K3LLP2_9STRA|nr:hypothetical protein IV203_026091 [Nitzschia inconspicua]